MTQIRIIFDEDKKRVYLDGGDFFHIYEDNITTYEQIAEFTENCINNHILIKGVCHTEKPLSKKLEEFIIKEASYIESEKELLRFSQVITITLTRVMNNIVNKVCRK